MRIITLIIISQFLLVASACAVSFDCTKAQSHAEKMLCEPNSAYSYLDDELSIAYQWTLIRTKHQNELVKEQQNWLKNVRDACRDAGCLVRAYVARTDELVSRTRFAGCYWLVPIVKDGKVQPLESVCLTMEKNLNRFCDEPPMACELKIAPEFAGQIVKPNWVSLDIETNRMLIEEFIRAPWESGVSMTQKQKDEILEIDRMEKSIANKELSFSRAQLDLYNLGKPQTAYRLDYGDCRALNSNLDNPRKWEWGNKSTSVKTQHAPEVVRQIFSQYIPLQHAPLDNVFLYEGKVYDYWMAKSQPGPWKAPAEFADLRVNRREIATYAEADKTYLVLRNVCHFNYKPVQGEQK